MTKNRTATTEMSEWYLYIIRCRNGSLYTGITTDVEMRFRQHEAGKGAKFLRGKSPLTLEFSTHVGPKSMALRLEALTKKQRKITKEKIIKEQNIDTLILLL